MRLAPFLDLREQSINPLWSHAKHRLVELFLLQDAGDEIKLAFSRSITIDNIRSLLRIRLPKEMVLSEANKGPES